MYKCTTPARLKIVLISLLSLLILGTFGYMGWQSKREYDAAISAAGQQLLANASSLSEHASQSIGMADRALLTICRTISQNKDKKDFDGVALHNLLKEQSAGLRQIGTVLAVDKHGNSLANGLEYPQKPVNVADRDYFLHHSKKLQEGLYIGRPVKSRVINRWIFALSRPLVKNDGTFDGLVVISFPVDYFDQFYKSVATSKGMQTVLLRTDGYLLVISPDTENAYNINIKNKILLDNLIHKAASGVFHNRESGIDNTDRLNGYARLVAPYNEIVAVVSVEREAVLADWKRHMFFNISGALVLLSVSVLLGMLLLLRLRELEQSSESLRISRSNLRTIFDSSRDAIFIHATDGSLVDVNARMLEMYGVNRDEAFGYSILKDYSSADNDFGQQPDLWRRVSNGETVIFEWIARRPKDGSCFPALVNLSRITMDSHYVILATVTDNTLQKQAEQAMRESEERFRTIFERSSIGIAFADPDGCLLQCNSSFQKLVGYETDELCGMNFKEFAWPEDIEAEVVLVKEIVRGIRDDYRIEKRYVTKAGDIVWVDLAVSVIRDKSGHPKNFVGLVADSTERKYTELSLARAKQAAESASLAKSRFLSTVSHEIRTPMNAIHGMTHLLRDTELDRQQSEYLDTISDASNSLLVIINDILDISKIEAGRMELVETSISLSGFLNSILALFKGKADEKQIGLTLETDSDLPEKISGDALRLRQVLVNLIGNAIKFTERGGVVLKAANICSDQDSAKIRFEVTDSGIGIESAHQATLFQPFTQADSSITRRFGGTGLGLSISSELLHLMDSELRFASTAGEGSTFAFIVRFRIPDDSATASGGMAGENSINDETGSINRAAVHEVSSSRELMLLTVELQALLEKQSMAAARKFEQLAEQLGETAAPELPLIGSCINRLDFTEAARLLQVLAEKYRIP